METEGYYEPENTPAGQENNGQLSVEEFLKSEGKPLLLDEVEFQESFNFLATDENTEQE